MYGEMKYLPDKNTLKLIKKPAGVRLVSCKWIFKVKEGTCRGQISQLVRCQSDLKSKVGC